MKNSPTSSPGVSDDSLLAQIAESDERAFASIVDRYAGLVECAARASGLDASEAPDLVQATFIVLWKQRKSPPAAAKLGNWLYGVTGKLASRHMRSRSRARRRDQNWHQQQYETMTHPPASSDDAPVAKAHRLALHRSLEKLGSAQRQLIIARFWQKKRFAAIGEELGCSEDAAKKRFATAIRKLQLLMAAAGLTSISSAAMTDMLQAEASIPSPLVTTGQGILHAPSQAASELAALWKYKPSPAIIGTAIAGTAAAIAFFLIALDPPDESQSAGSDPSITDRSLPAHTRKSERHSFRSTAVPLSEWTSSDPVTLLQCPPNTPGKRFIWHFPMSIEWLNGKPLLPVASGFKTPGNTFHLFTQTDDGWTEAVTIEGLHFPRTIAVSNETIGIVGNTGENPKGSYGASLFYYSYDPEKGVSEPWTLIAPPSPNDRVTLVGLNELTDNQLLAVMLMESRGSKNRLIETRSTDAGKTWSDPVDRRDTDMGQDHATAMGVVELGEAGLGVFHMQRNEPLELLVAPTDGGDWETRPIQFTDDLPAGVRRTPLKAVATSRGIQIAYLANDRKQPGGTYYLASSDDAGRSWRQSQPIVTVDKVDDMSGLFGLSSSHNQLVATFIESGEQWSNGDFRTILKASDDGGLTWSDLPGSDHEVLVSSASLSPYGDRAFVTEVVAGPDGSENFQVREISPSSKEKH